MPWFGDEAARLVQDGAAAVFGAPPASSLTKHTMTSSLPSVRNIAKYALGGAQLLLGSAPQVRGSSLQTCDSPQLSCHNTSAVENLCCFNAPGGQLLQTQFWDFDPATGPVDSWTVHGLWPDKCDGSYDANCDSSRVYTNITQILQTFGKADLLNSMSTYWKDYQGNDHSLWQHEWSKHGTCISTLEPQCYADHQPTEEVADYFQKAMDVYTSLPSYQWLSAAGINPSTTATYTSAQIQAALSAKHGQPVTIRCRNGALQEIWYHFDVRGSVQMGEFVASEPDGTKSSCPAAGVKYLPKGQSGTSSPTATTATQTTSTQPTGTSAPFSGKGFLMAATNGAQKGCIISPGTWYTSGTCATFRAAEADGGFTLKSSRGNCGISGGAFSCGSGVSSPTVFSATEGKLSADGNTAFYADAMPAGTVQQRIFTQSHPIQLEIQWQGL